MAIEPDFTLTELAFVLVEFCLSLWRTPRRILSCSSFPFPNAMISFEMFLHPGRPVRSSLIDSWKISDAALIPNGKRL